METSLSGGWLFFFFFIMLVMAIWIVAKLHDVWSYIVEERVNKLVKERTADEYELRKDVLEWVSRKVDSHVRGQIERHIRDIMSDTYEEEFIDDLVARIQRKQLK